MGKEVTHPQHNFAKRTKGPIIYPSQTANSCHPNYKAWPSKNKPSLRSNHNSKYSISQHTKRSRSKDARTSPKSFAMEHFTLITQGESLKMLKRAPKSDDILIVSSIRMINPNKTTTQKSITWRNSNGSKLCNTSSWGIYAGSGFAISPSPESLPLPSFSKNMMTFHSSATRDLRRLLGLDKNYKSTKHILGSQNY